MPAYFSSPVWAGCGPDETGPPTLFRTSSHLKPVQFLRQRRPSATRSRHREYLRRVHQPTAAVSRLARCSKPAICLLRPGLVAELIPFMATSHPSTFTAAFFGYALLNGPFLIQIHVSTSIVVTAVEHHTAVCRSFRHTATT